MMLLVDAIRTFDPFAGCAFDAFAGCAFNPPAERGANGDSFDAHVIVEGMTISCHSWGWEWGTDEMVQSMRTLKELGVNWISIHPYAGILADGTVSTRRFDPNDPPQWLLRPIQEAHALGLKIMIKPHIAYWGSKFAWRGEIEFQTDQQWNRFFETYTKWISDLAQVCKDADAFTVGTELDRTVKFEQRWRNIIREVRDVFPGHLTYSANWDSYHKVKFWDALDVIGIQAYFPLVRHENLPSRDELDRGWERIINTLTKFSAKNNNKKIVFGELGYNRSSRAAFKPWESRSDNGPIAEQTQKQSMAAALDAIATSDLIVGAFLWKWFPGEKSGSNFDMASETMREVIAAAWDDGGE